MKPTMAQLEEENRHLEAENLRLSGELFTMREKLGYYERAEVIADETRAKRYFDGQGDE